MRTIENPRDLRTSTIEFTKWDPSKSAKRVPYPPRHSKQDGKHPESSAWAFHTPCMASANASCPLLSAIAAGAVEVRLRSSSIRRSSISSRSQSPRSISSSVKLTWVPPFLRQLHHSRCRPISRHLVLEFRTCKPGSPANQRDSAVRSNVDPMGNARP